MNGDQTLSQSFFDNQSFQYVGLLALEVALFEDIDDSSASVSELTDEPRKCQVLHSIPHDVPQCRTGRWH